MDFEGVIIEESLEEKSILKELAVIKTKVETVTEEHKTPWLTQWTLHTVRVPEKEAEAVVEKVSKALEQEHEWYADFKNNETHYVIFHNRVFKVDRSKPEQYKPVVEHGLSLGIPDYQLDFSPAIKEWERPK